MSRFQMEQYKVSHWSSDCFKGASGVGHVKPSTKMTYLHTFLTQIKHKIDELVGNEVFTQYISLHKLTTTENVLYIYYEEGR